MRVSNILNHKNQYLIYHEGEVYFQSYDTLMATFSFEDGYGRVLEMRSNYWSATTGKHMKAFLEETRMLYPVLDLIHKYKLFKSFKDFMERVQKLKLFMGSVTVEYKNNRGELVTFTCKEP